MADMYICLFFFFGFWINLGHTLLSEIKRVRQGSELTLFFCLNCSKLCINLLNYSDKDYKDYTIKVLIFFQLTGSVQ